MPVEQKYIKAFGDSYDCVSPYNAQLTDIFCAECRKHGILYLTDDVFAYMKEFEQKERQISMFDVVSKV